MANEQTIATVVVYKYDSVIPRRTNYRFHIYGGAEGSEGGVPEGISVIYRKDVDNDVLRVNKGMLETLCLKTTDRHITEQELNEELARVLGEQENDA